MKISLKGAVGKTVMVPMLMSFIGFAVAPDAGYSLGLTRTEIMDCLEDELGY